MLQRRGLLAGLTDRWLTREERERLRAIPTRQNEYGFDPFGFHREDFKLCLSVGKLLYRHYFRTSCYGIENLPAGRVLLVANHSGQLPFDALNIGAAAFFEANPPRVVRSMTDNFVPTIPYIGRLFARCGQVLGSVDNCRRLLCDEEAVLVFPEGTRGIAKSFTKRYQLQPFGLGFIRLALLTHCPIVPVAVVGAEEQAPAIDLKPLARLLGAPAFPITPFPPFVPILPLPVRYRLYFGEPRCFTGDPEDDDEHIAELARQIRLSIESMVRMGLKQRRSIWV